MKVEQLQASDCAFAAILGDGSVVTWGDAASGGDSRPIQDKLKNVLQVQATHSAFAAIRGDGSVVTWHDAGHGGDSSAAQSKLQKVQQIQATRKFNLEFPGAFAAILGDGSVVPWGGIAPSRAAQNQLINVVFLMSS